jgi:PAS domain S-box-containing protein
LTLPRLPGKYIVQSAVFFVGYCIAGKLGQATINIISSNLGPVWPAYGVALAAFLLCGYRIWPVILSATFLVAFFSPVTHLTALGQAAGSTLAALSGALLLQRVAKFDKSLSHVRDAVALIAFGALASAVISASIGTLVLYVSQVHAYSGLGSAWLIYWLGDATGVLVITPLVLTLPNFPRIRDSLRLTELLVLLLLLTCACFLIFGDPAVVQVRLHTLAFAVLPFVMWAAIRLGVSGAALSILLVTAIATVETALGSGPFATNTAFINAVLLDVYFTVISVTGLTLAAAIAEREEAEHERERAFQERASMEARLRADEAVRDNEERLRLAAESGKMYAYDWNVATDKVVPSDEFANILGSRIDPGSLTRERFLIRVHPDDCARIIAVVDSLTPERPIAHISYRIFRPDGDLVWLEEHGRAFFDAQGKIVRMIGMVADITQRKRAEEAVQGMNRRLIEAQEQERARIGRELHDDINQRLGMLAIELEQLRGDPSEVRSRAQELRKQAIEISNDVQALSHELHASKLEYLGVVAGIKSWCREFGERHRMDVSFNHEISTALPFEVGLCLLRVVQEALHNSLKHSGVRQVEVQLAEYSNEVHLVISDSGSGFDVERAKQGRGLGLTSMQERIRLVNGTIAIQSKPMGGTAIHVHVPLGAQFTVSDRAVGQ